jgi:hypothetical protein
MYDDPVQSNPPPTAAQPPIDVQEIPLDDE